MKREPWLAGLLTLVLTLLVVSVCTGKGQASEHAEAAQSAASELADQVLVIEAAEATAALQDTLVAELRSTLESERTERVVERAGYRASIATEQAEHETLIDSVISRVDSTTAEILVRAQVADSLVHENYERVILSQAEDMEAKDRELVETRRQALFAQRGWDLATEGFELSELRGDRWEAAYNAQGKNNLKWKLVAAGEALVILLTR